MEDSEKQLRGIAGTRRTVRELSDGTIRLQVDIEPRHRKDFFELLGEIDMPIAIAPLDPKVLKPDLPAEEVSNPLERGFRTLAQRMHINGYFRNPKFWRALHTSGIYTLNCHKQWIESQDCIMQGVLNSPCHGDVVLHHCASAAIPAAGAGLQPEHPNKVPHWYGVPLCHEHHRNWLHQGGATREDKEQLQTYAVGLMSAQAKVAMKKYLGLDSLASLNQELLDEFEQTIGFESNASA